MKYVILSISTLLLVLSLAMLISAFDVHCHYESRPKAHIVDKVLACSDGVTYSPY